MAGIGNALGFGCGLEVEGEDDENYWGPGGGRWESASAASSAPSFLLFLLLLALFYPATLSLLLFSLLIDVFTQLSQDSQVP